MTNPATTAPNAPPSSAPGRTTRAASRNSSANLRRHGDELAAHRDEDAHPGTP
ncbi:hypothetical protein AB0L33_09485 [Streptomyces sp. NPDC052299]|uniref:hypothetical protein n=1 Tax=Streptomyces sp. NPDC052299 TaxID=3155054 RepID=UPI00343F2D25